MSWNPDGDNPKNRCNSRWRRAREKHVDSPPFLTQRRLVICSFTFTIMKILLSCLLSVIHFIYSRVLAFRLYRQQQQHHNPQHLLANRKRLPKHLAIAFVLNQGRHNEQTKHAVVESVSNLVEWCRAVGIQKLTLYEENGALHVDLCRFLIPNLFTRPPLAMYIGYSTESTKVHSRVWLAQSGKDVPTPDSSALWLLWFSTFITQRCTQFYSIHRNTRTRAQQTRKTGVYMGKTRWYECSLVLKIHYNITKQPRTNNQIRKI